MRLMGFLAHRCFMYLLLSLDLKKCMGVHSLVIISERLKYSSDNVIFLFGFSLDCRISVQIFPLEYFENIATLITFTCCYCSFAENLFFLSGNLKDFHFPLSVLRFTVIYLGNHVSFSVLGEKFQKLYI